MPRAAFATEIADGNSAARGVRSHPCEVMRRRADQPRWTSTRLDRSILFHHQPIARASRSPNARSAETVL